MQYSPIASLRRAQIQTILLRCQVLQSILKSIACRPCAADAARLQYQYIEDMQALAHKARQLAEGVQDRGLQARSEYWAGQACKGTNDVSAAMNHFQRATILDDCCDGEYTDGRRVQGLTAREKRDLDDVLRLVQCFEGEEENNPWSAVEQCLAPRSPHAASLTARERSYIQKGVKTPRSSYTYTQHRATTLKEELEISASTPPLLTADVPCNFPRVDSVLDCPGEEEDALTPLNVTVMCNQAPVELKE